jgi:hypothetical protein
MRIRRPRLRVQVVAVVPDDHQAEVADRREHRGPGARDDPDHAAPDGQPAAVAFRGPEPGGQRDVLARAEQPGQRGVHQIQVGCVRQHDQRAPAGRRRRARRPGDLLRPMRARQGGPDRARRPPGGQRGQERGSRGVPRPRPRLRPSPARPADGRLPGQVGQVGRACRDGGRGGGSRFGRDFLFGPGVPGRDGQPQHVRHGPRVPVGHLPGQGRDLRAQRRLRRDHPVQPGQPPRVLAGWHPVQQVPVDQLAGEPDPDPAARHRLVSEPFRDQVIERPVQVGQRDVHRHPGHRQHRRVRPRIPPSPRRTAARLAAVFPRGCPLPGCPCHAPVLPDPPDAQAHRRTTTPPVRRPPAQARPSSL